MIKFVSLLLCSYCMNSLTTTADLYGELGYKNVKFTTAAWGLTQQPFSAQQWEGSEKCNPASNQPGQTQQSLVSSCWTHFPATILVPLCPFSCPHIVSTSGCLGPRPTHTAFPPLLQQAWTELSGREGESLAQEVGLGSPALTWTSFQLLYTAGMEEEWRGVWLNHCASLDLHHHQIMLIF